MQNNKGFTLIELLVVIAIIGILSGLIIVSMGGAQNAAKDARIKSAMDQMRSTAEIYKLNNAGVYGTGAGVAAGVQGNALNFSGVTDGLALYNDIDSQTAGAIVLNISTGPAYCFSVVMNASTNCVDSTGKVGTTVCGTAYVCP
jgi:prepilin-type N-terminal cleavage/methylation domain-containing protein